MSFARVCFAVLIGLSGVASAAPEGDLGQQYLAVYLGINAAEHLEAKSDVAGALKDFQDCYMKLNALHVSDPDWQTALIIHRLEDCRTQIIDLQLKLSAGKESAEDTLAKVRATYPGPAQMQLNHHAPSYAWKTNVAANLFWIGKNGVNQSAWDNDWVKSNGGVDSPGDRNGFSAAAHVDKLNPFYVALPFNDLAPPDAARKWIPASWSRQPKDDKPVSACKDRWLEVKNGNGRVCYAQWEDAGPSGDADPDYVFGPSVPKSGDKPALSVSPAVAQYLGLQDDTDRVSWRFVDEADVAPGQWLKYQEQGLIYAAMNK
jgi:hypothetical protein